MNLYTYTSISKYIYILQLRGLALGYTVNSDFVALKRWAFKKEEVRYERPTHTRIP